MTEKLTLPYPEHKVEVDPAKEVPAFDATTYEALMSLSHEEIEARAGEFGITPNSGIVPIEVDGQRRYIDTDIEDFGTNVPNVVEIVKQASPETDSSLSEADASEALTEKLMAEHGSPDEFAHEADAELDRQIDERILEATDGADQHLENMDHLLTVGAGAIEAVGQTLEIVYQEINNVGYQNLSPEQTYRELETIANTLQTVRNQIDATFNGIGTASSSLTQLAHNLAKAKQELDQKVAEHGKVRDQAEDNGAVELETAEEPKIAQVAELQAVLGMANEKLSNVLAQANMYNQAVISIMVAVSNAAEGMSYGGAPNASFFYQLNEVVAQTLAQSSESVSLQREALAAIAATKTAYAELVTA